MKVYDVLELATRNLRESALRNCLTTLGIAVGVASLVAMLSLGIGLQELANRRLSRSGLFDTVVVTSRRDFHGFDPKAGAAPSEWGRNIDDEARAEIAKLPHVIETFPAIRFMSEVRYADKPQPAAVAGLPLSARDDEAFDEMHGRFFSGPAAGEAILLEEFAKELNTKPAALIGHTMVLRYAERRPLSDPADNIDNLGGFTLVRRDYPLRIVGIIASAPYGGLRGMARSGVFIPIALAEKLRIMQPGDLRGMANTSGKPVYISLTVRTTGPNQVPTVEQLIRKMGFGTYSLMDATRNLRRFFAVLDLFLGIFGSLALAVAALGIVNTLVMAILERRHEIGIMKAIGASDGDIKRLFFAEAAAMGAVGGAGGVVLGWALGRAINFGANVYLQRQQLPPETLWSVPWWLVVAALLFSILVTLLSGVFPASRAAALDPVQALRYE
ncbi:MAG: ABC transporter permease [Terriglobales bacterium]